jgi:acid stress-induced BolA-like protein IbaG/YrbA
MPLISTFYGLIVRLYFYDNEKHHLPHLHVEYAGEESSFDIQTGDMLAGKLPVAKQRLIVAWIELHREELMANWKLAVVGDKPERIAPLK